MGDRAYVVTDDQAITASPGDTVLTIQSAVTVRPEVYEINVSNQGTMADATIQWLLRRFDTDDGTGDSLTARPLDTKDSAASVTCQGNHTTEPSSFTMTLCDWHVHLRANFMWRAAPRHGIVLPAVATEGIALTPIHATQTNLVTGVIFFTE